MHIDETGIPGLLVLTPARFGDARGFFSETWNRARLSENGIDIDFVQDNHSLSAAVGTVRGLHFQAPPHAQAKLVRCGRGALFDVAVDIRKGSPTYGRWFGIELTFDNGKQLLIPAGFAHGFRDPRSRTRRSSTNAPTPMRRRPKVRFATTTRYRHRLGPWQSEAILSDKDAAADAFAGYDSPFVYEETRA
jgi:dTDP-4-dehydrorhamnose 3,5-epimerase